MNTRDAIEQALRAWNQHEITRGAAPVIDFDFHPTTEEPPAPADRLTTYLRLTDLLEDSTEPALAQRVTADLTYLRARLGEHLPLHDYIQATQGCPAAGWPPDYITAIGDTARRAIEDRGITWGMNTVTDLAAAEGPLDPQSAPDAIQAAAADLEPVVRRLTGTDADYELSIETADVDAYWSYWLDGAGPRVRLRLNTRHASYTKVQARQFALHEVLGHGLQSASISARCATDDVPWVRLLSVHGPQQVLLEGLAQAMPLFITPDDPALIARVRLDHYTQLVRAELHLAINSGTSIPECARHARTRVPWWTNDQIANLLTDRSTNPLLRTYMWAYAAGIDWFTHLADHAEPTAIDTVLHAAYRAPLTPTELQKLWPHGPTIGGHSSAGCDGVQLPTSQ